MICAHVGLGARNQAHNAFFEDVSAAAAECRADPVLFAEVSKFLFSLRSEVVQGDQDEAALAPKKCKKCKKRGRRDRDGD